MRTIVFSLFSVCATLPSAGAQDSAQPKPDAAGKAPNYPVCVSIFNGKDFAG